jgi:hypothetical protein
LDSDQREPGRSLQASADLAAAIEMAEENEDQ